MAAVPSLNHCRSLCYLGNEGSTDGMSEDQKADAERKLEEQSMKVSTEEVTIFSALLDCHWPFRTASAYEISKHRHVVTYLVCFGRLCKAFAISLLHKAKMEILMPLQCLVVPTRLRCIIPVRTRPRLIPVRTQLSGRILRYLHSRRKTRQHLSRSRHLSPCGI